MIIADVRHRPRQIYTSVRTPDRGARSAQATMRRIAATALAIGAVAIAIGVAERLA